MIYGWSPSIGDPTVWGWLTVANYFVACLVAARAARIDRGNAAVWWAASLAMLALCVNKQLDLQSLATVVGRAVAIEEGWYPYHRTVQRYFIEAICVLAACGVAVACYRLRKSAASVLCATAGLVLLTAFVVARAASFHHMDIALGFVLAGLELNHLAENAGIALVLAGAAMAGRTEAEQ